MLKKLHGMKLKARLDFGYRIVIMLMVVSGIVSIIGVGVLYGKLQSYANGAQKADTAVKECRININIAARNVREMALSTDKSTYQDYKDKITEKLEELRTSLDTLESTGVVDESLYMEYETAVLDWETIGFEIIDEIEAGDVQDAADKILNECAPALEQVVEISKELDEVTDEQKENALMASKVIGIVVIVIVIVFIITAAIISGKLGVEIVRSITKPLGEVEKAAKELTEGNLHSTLEYRSDDELGSVAESLRTAIQILGTYVDDIGRAMKQFSKGNFTVQPEVEWRGDFTEILNSFLEFEQSMASMITGVQDVAIQVNSGAEQVAASSMDLAEAATEQAGITEELKATIDTVADQVAQNAEHAKHISLEVENIGSEIVRSDDKMQTMVASMSEISKASQEISKIIATINEIASQTNLLALNASIEAARAGEAGKGFAVVADQVSLLATQSAEAAAESTVLIQASVDAVDRGIAVADETAQQLQRVMADSKVIIEEVNGVAEALEAQSDAIAQINMGVDNINDVVQTNSATSEECAASSQEMNSQSETLEELVKRLQIVDIKN